MNQTNTQSNITQPETAVVVRTSQNVGLPFDIETDLEKYDHLIITKEIDPFRLVHCFEAPMRDYKIHAVTKDGYKKFLFSAIYHFDCCNICEQCVCGYMCCAYACCDSIQFQMDYKRDGSPFYTQGLNIAKGCYCCKCGYCCYCCPPSILFLRENVEPENPNPKVGIQKGFSEVPNTCCCSCCRDKTAFYNTQEGLYHRYLLFRGCLSEALCKETWHKH